MNRMLGLVLAALAMLLIGCTKTATAPHVPVGLPSTAADAAGNVSVVAAGDIACAPGEAVTSTTCQQAATAALAQSLHPDAVIALGDLQYESGSASDFTQSYDKTWGRLRQITRPLPGNHEYKTSGAAGYFASVDAKDPWYAWDAGTWRIYLLDSNCDDIDCGAEQDWLKADLAAHPRDCTAITMHAPRYSSGAHHSQRDLAGFWQVAYAAHVDLALAGHDHDYERFAPMDAEANLRPGRGITSFVVGTGGKSLYDRHAEAPGSQYFESTSFGVLHLTLGPTAFRWQFVDLGHRVLDHGSTQCG